MRVHVDEARRHELAPRVDLFCSLGNIVADRGDLPVGYSKVGFIGIAAGSVDDGAIANHEAGRRHADTPRREGDIVGQRGAMEKRLRDPSAETIGTPLPWNLSRPA